jgi:hypothetical protein
MRKTSIAQSNIVIKNLARKGERERERERGRERERREREGEIERELGLV